MTLIQDAPSPNQAPPLQAYNVATNDGVLMEALDGEGGEWAGDRVRQLGEQAGRPETLDLGRLAENPPKLRTHDRYGKRIDEVEFHPAWHELMRMSIGAGISSLPKWPRVRHPAFGHPFRRASGAPPAAGLGRAEGALFN